MILRIALLLFVLLFALAAAEFRSDLPKLIDLRQDRDVATFESGNDGENFKLLDIDGDHLLIGARNAVYNVSLRSFKGNDAWNIQWPPAEAVHKECTMKGKSKNECQNYIRVLSRDYRGGLLVCGTNAFLPWCKVYEGGNSGDELRENLSFEAKGVSPFDPNHNSTFFRDGDMLYTGTVADFAGGDALIHRRDVTKEHDLGVRTEQADDKFLNKPQFVGAMKHKEHVMMWFAEEAVECDNCGPTIYSRVARVCTNDLGNNPNYPNQWTTFAKARLNCSIPGDFPFYFDRIQSISTLIPSKSKTPTSNLIYAVFTSSLSGVSQSAICAYDISQIWSVFSTSNYLTQDRVGDLWKVTKVSKSADRIHECEFSARNLTDSQLKTARTNVFMEKPIGNFFHQPVSVQLGPEQMTQIAVEAQVSALDGRFYDILYVGTDRGNVFKIVNLARAAAPSKFVSHQVLTMKLSKDPIRKLLLVEDSAQIVAVTETKVFKSPIAFCNQSKTCEECIGLRDPQCAFDVALLRCEAISAHLITDKERYIQSVESGDMMKCAGKGKVENKMENSERNAQQQDQPRVNPKMNAVITSAHVSQEWADPKESVDSDGKPKDATTQVTTLLTAGVSEGIIRGVPNIIVVGVCVGILALLAGVFIGICFTYRMYVLSNEKKSHSISSSYYKPPSTVMTISSAGSNPPTTPPVIPSNEKPINAYETGPPPPPPAYEGTLGRGGISPTALYSKQTYL
ncbi:hypothetical protein L596_007966 [Steinernema carpocapsae]|uniref:Sema domain-containing protein n=1 Tax=Steinernema carpocapsae TaxID=34508 RepID=A0A4U5PB45_STECR|nr:hypothetical protein L596_007966 [Steinernema carpocapsae]